MENKLDSICDERYKEIRNKPVVGSGNGNGLKALIAIVGGGIISLAALVGIMASIVRPMQQSIAGLEHQINSIRADMKTDDQRELHDVEERGALSERFKEVETQFRNAKERQDDHFKLPYHIAAGENFGQMKEMFREMETQIRLNKERMLREVEILERTKGD